MYLRWAEKKGFQTQIIDILAGEEAGLKNVTFTVNGPYAYGYLRAEIGIHRLVRISPFDAGARRHTSFASVFVIPEIPDDIVIEIDEKDLKIDTYRSGGAGGQHVNKTDSAVRITHLPTGIVVQCQNERSQHKNKAIALKVLRARLYEKEMKEKEEKLEQLHTSKKEIAWGSQIRSYVMHPYKMVKDHRTDQVIHQVDRVLDGELDELISAYLLTAA
jgi:peptide chain release factor 2